VTCSWALLTRSAYSESKIHADRVRCQTRGAPRESRHAPFDGRTVPVSALRPISQEQAPFRRSSVADEHHTQSFSQAMSDVDSTYGSMPSYGSPISSYSSAVSNTAIGASYRRTPGNQEPPDNGLDGRYGWNLSNQSTSRHLSGTNLEELQHPSATREIDNGAFGAQSRRAASTTPGRHAPPTQHPVPKR